MLIRKQYNPVFKAKGAPEALKSERTAFISRLDSLSFRCRGHAACNGVRAVVK